MSPEAQIKIWRKGIHLGTAVRQKGTISINKKLAQGDVRSSDVDRGGVEKGRVRGMSIRGRIPERVHMEPEGGTACVHQGCDQRMSGSQPKAGLEMMGMEKIGTGFLGTTAKACDQERDRRGKTKL